jgi:hypothetical protein
MMRPEDIPVEVTKWAYNAPLPRGAVLSQNEAADLLAHFWPAIAVHLRSQHFREAAEIAYEAGERFYDDRGLRAAEAAWDVSEIIKDKAAE